MKALLFTFLAVCPFFFASAQDSVKVKDLEQRIRNLEERMAMLEGRMVRTESSNATNQQTPGAKEREKAFLQRREEDRKNFNAQDIAKAEQLYQQAAQLYMNSASESKQLLDSVVSTYPQLNRAGCAQLYRAQQEDGPEKERLLNDCIARFGTCYYGAQVGPLAIFQLARYYQLAGKEQDAQELFRKLRKKYSESVGHDGILLVDKI